MLTPELVRAKRSAGELVILPLAGKKRLHALELAEELLGVARDLVGRSRSELAEALTAVSSAPSERKLASGLAKLVIDECAIEEQSMHDPAALRRDVFMLAAAVRRSGERFDRARVLAEVAARTNLGADAIEAGLYADLNSAHVVLAAPVVDAEGLLERYRFAELQAILLRAVRVTATVRCEQPAAYRELFQKLKFRRLLHRIERLPDGRHRIEIDGPFSLFESVTKYGLQLAQVLPALEAADALELVAELRWGKAREPLVFRHRTEPSGGRRARDPARLPDEVQSLLEALSASDSPWRAAPASEVFELPGIGLCVPDLVLSHRDSGRRVYLEVLGYWSRDAVWRRVELAEAGLPEPMLFAASSRLRVSPEVLDDVERAALYVYKGTMSPRAVLERVSILGA